MMPGPDIGLIDIPHGEHVSGIEHLESTRHTLCSHKVRLEIGAHNRSLILGEYLRSSFPRGKLQLDGRAKTSMS